MQWLTDLHGADVFLGGNALIIEAQPLFNLLLHLVPESAAGYLTEAVNPAATIQLVALSILQTQAQAAEQSIACL